METGCRNDASAAESLVVAIAEVAVGRKVVLVACVVRIHFVAYVSNGGVGVDVYKPYY